LEGGDHGLFEDAKCYLDNLVEKVRNIITRIIEIAVENLTGTSRTQI